MTVKHIVIWNLKATDAGEKAEASARIESALTALVGRVPSIRSLTVALNGAYPDKNADIAVVADFDDYEGLDEYQNHPDHLEAAGIIRSFVSGRSSIDYTY